MERMCTRPRPVPMCAGSFGTEVPQDDACVGEGAVPSLNHETLIWKANVVKKATTFLFVLLNGTWALMAYLLHRSGVHPALIATVVAIGVVLGNLAGYAGLRLAERLLRKRG